MLLVNNVIKLTINNVFISVSAVYKCNLNRYLLAASRCFCFMIMGPAEQITSPSLSSAFYFKIRSSVWMFYIVV